MAQFQHSNKTLQYQMIPAPFDFDLFLLQGPRFNEEIWQPVLEDFAKRPSGEGRVITSTWPDSQVEEVFSRMFQTLGLVHLHLVAVDEAVPAVRGWLHQIPEIIQETLLLQDLPKPEALKEKIQEFCKL